MIIKGHWSHLGGVIFDVKDVEEVDVVEVDVEEVYIEVGEGDKEDPMERVLLLFFPLASLILGIATVGFVTSAGFSSGFCFSSVFVGVWVSFLIGVQRNPFLIVSSLLNQGKLKVE